MSELPVKQDNMPATQSNMPAQYSADTSGMSTLDLTADVIKTLAAPVRDNEILIHPISGALYAHQNFYRARLDTALGVGRWALKCESKPMFDAEASECFYDGSLWVNGHYVSRAIGSARWIATNKLQSKGDAFEGAKSDCLKRCCKDIGMFRELWTPSFTEAWKSQHCIQEGGRWRLKNRAAVDVAPDYVEVMAHETTPAPTRPQQQRPAATAPAAVGDAPPFRNDKIGFGKHRDETWAEVQTDWLEWIVEQPDKPGSFVSRDGKLSNKDKAKFELAYRQQQVGGGGAKSVPASNNNTGIFPPAEEEHFDETSIPF